MLNNIPYLIRSSEPNKFDTADYGTLCKVSYFCNEPFYYIQMNPDIENPKWIKLDAKDDKEAYNKMIELTGKNNLLDEIL
jgi:hypothetical protein